MLLQSPALKQALMPYTVAGPWGRLLDAEAERIGSAECRRLRPRAWSARPRRPPC